MRKQNAYALLQGRYYDAIDAGDLHGAVESLTPDVSWSHAQVWDEFDFGLGPVENFESRSEVGDFFRELLPKVGQASIRHRVRAHVHGGDRGGYLGTVLGENGDEAWFLTLYELRDGLISRYVTRPLGSTPLDLATRIAAGDLTSFDRVAAERLLQRTYYDNVDAGRPDAAGMAFHEAAEWSHAQVWSHHQFRRGAPTTLRGRREISSLINARVHELEDAGIRHQIFDPVVDGGCGVAHGAVTGPEGKDEPFMIWFEVRDDLIGRYLIRPV